MVNTERHTEHTKRIISYLSYLRDISRKVVSRSGFEKCLLNKAMGYGLYIDNISFELVPTDKHYQKLKSYLNFIEASNDKKMFIGFGTFVGTSKRIFAAPFIILQCELSIDEQSQKIVIEPDFDTLNLNYDFISSLSTNYLNEEEDVFNPISDAEQQTIERIEKELKGISSLNFESFTNLTNKVFKDFTTNIEHFKEVKQIDIENYDYPKELGIYIKRFSRKNKNKENEKEKSIFEKQLIFVNAHHLFVNQIPDQLSTYEALNTFVQNITEENDFKNPVVEKLLVNALTDERTEIEFTENQEVEELIKNFVPLSLSSTQVQAIKNAWSNEISYIQGPPGTGKSHTISALVLSALFLNKKVLVISQKPAALKVVKEKIEPYLSDDDKITGICYFDKTKTARDGIRDFCDFITNFAYNTRNLYSTIKNLESEIERIKISLLAKINEQKKEHQRLETALAKQKEHKDLNDEFLKSLKRLNDNYTEVQKGFKFRRINKPAAYFKTIDRVQKICESTYQNIATKLYLHKFKNHLIEKFNTPNDWLNISDFPSFSRDFIKLNKIFTTVQNKQRELTTDTNGIRKNIKNLSEDILQLQNSLIKLKYKLNLFSKAKQIDYQTEIQKFYRMLYNTSSRIIDIRMREIDFNKVTDTISFWSAEIRHLGHLFPLQPDIFDLVVVDESSQVNLAEILPAFYRGKKICIVGDHHQLSIKSTGLSFALSASFDKLTWNHYSDTPEKRFLSFENATKKCLTVSKASILDFIKSDYYKAHINEIMLDEHFRSLPHLSKYTSREFYKDPNNPDGKLKIMTETPHNLSLNCFKAIRVDGKRETETGNKFIRAEALKIIELILFLINPDDKTLFSDSNDFYFPEHIDREKYTIGVISMIRDQCELIKELAEERLPEIVKNKYELMVGTPEEFQGNERDIMIFSLCLDTNCIMGQGFFQDEKRLNVATSRAKSFTYFVYSPFPVTFNKIYKYLQYFNGQVTTDDTTTIKLEDITPKLSPLKIDEFASDFERYVYYYLGRYIQTKSEQVEHEITLHNQIKSCGQKRLDFVIYNHTTKKSAAVEVDGRIGHFEIDGRTPTEKHIERIEILTRAGWNIINTPYHKWYKDGWLSEDNSNYFKQEIERIYEDIDRLIF